MELSEGKARHSQKHSTNVSERCVSLTPMINSCKLHLATVKSAGRAQATTASQDLATETPLNATQTICHSNPENRLHASSQKRLIQTPPVPSFSADNSHTTQGTRDKPSRPTHSAGATNYYKALKIPKPGGGSAGYCRNPAPGFNVTQLPFASNFQRIDLDRRCLKDCPQLEIVEELYILNLQHNRIRRISHVSNLQQLIVLNLHDNHISNMTGIEVLTSLRMLQLGKNRPISSVMYCH